MNLSAENIGKIRELVRSGYPLKARDAKDLLGHNDHLVELLEARGRLMLGVEIERDQLKAEVDSLAREADRQYTTIEAYRKDAERFQWLLKNASVILDKKTAYQAETGFIKYDTMPGRTETELAIDAAMGKGEQS